MTTQPEALRLADKMSSYNLCSGYAWHCHKAAAELRRLHEVNQELLIAMQKIAASSSDEFGSYYTNRGNIAAARAAIAKAEGEIKGV